MRKILLFVSQKEAKIMQNGFCVHFAYTQTKFKQIRDTLCWSGALFCTVHDPKA
jgi:hypothetical protein